MQIEIDSLKIESISRWGCRHLVTRIFLTPIFLTRVTPTYSDLTLKRIVSMCFCSSHGRQYLHLCFIQILLGLHRGARPRITWRVCAATLTPIFKPPGTEWLLFIFHILFSPNDPHFQNALSLNDPILKIKMLSLNNSFLEVNAITEWAPFSPINDHLLICTQYLFGRGDLYSCSILHWDWMPHEMTPFFFLKTEGFTKRPPSFYSPH